MEVHLVRLPLLVSTVLAVIPPAAVTASEAAPEGMVWISDGEFTMGSELPGTRRNEQPTHKVTIDGSGSMLTM